MIVAFCFKTDFCDSFWLMFLDLTQKILKINSSNYQDWKVLENSTVPRDNKTFSQLCNDICKQHFPFIYSFTSNHNYLTSLNAKLFPCGINHFYRLHRVFFAKQMNWNFPNNSWERTKFPPGETAAPTGYTIRERVTNKSSIRSVYRQIVQ